MTLAHTIENKVEAAYRQNDLLEKRRDMMQAWETYVLFPTATESPNQTDGVLIDRMRQV